MQETQEAQVLSLGQADPLEAETATYSSILAWEIPLTEEPGRIQSMGCKQSDVTEQPSERSGRFVAISLSVCQDCHILLAFFLTGI